MVKKDYFVCPLCGMNKIVKSHKREEKGRAEELKWPIIDLKTAFSVQIREGGGKQPGSGKHGKGKAPGIGFRLIPSESLTLVEVLKNSEYDAITEGMKEQLIRLVKDSLEIGFIKESDLK